MASIKKVNSLKIGLINRLTIKNKGEVICQDAEAYNINSLDKGESGRYTGLMINMIYGGGNNKNSIAWSHHFIELYNQSTSSTDLNLKGLYISIKSNTGY